MPRRGVVDTTRRWGATLGAAAALGGLAACTGEERLAPVPPPSTSSTSAASAGSGAGGGWSAGPTDPGTSGLDVRWAHRWGGRRTDERVMAVVAEPDDAVVIAGTIGAFDGVEPTLVTADEDDVLLVRYDGDGAVAGTRVLGSFGHDAPRSLARRGDGSLVVTGVFGTVLDEVDPALVAYGGLSVFIMALDVDLTPQWGAAILGADVGRGQIASAVTGDGAVVVAGTWSRVLAVADTIVVNDGETDGFVARFDEDGALSWVTLLDGDGTSHLEIGAAVAVEGAVVVGAQLEGTLALGGRAIAESAGAPRPVLVRVDAHGALVSTSVLRGTGSASVGRMVRHDEGLVATLALGGTLVLPDTVLEAAGEGDATLVWLDADDRPASARTWGDRRSQGIAALDRDAGGHLLAGGSFLGALDLGLGAHKAPDGRPDGFVAELSPDGVALRSFVVGDPDGSEGTRTGSQSVAGVAWLGDGGLVAAGSFTGALRIGDVELDARGDLDGWVARVAPR